MSKRTGLGQPMTQGLERVVPMCHIVAIVLIENRANTNGQCDMSCIMPKLFTQ